MTRLLESIPTPPPVTVSPVGVGSTASTISQSPGLPRTPTDGVAGAPGGSSPGFSAGSRSGSSTGSRGRGRGGQGRGSNPQGSGRASTPQGSGRASTPRVRPRGRAKKLPRRPNPSPTLPWSRSSAQASPTPLNRADLQRRLHMLLQDQEKIAAGRPIANITTTNSIVTSYKEGGRPSLQSNSSRLIPFEKKCLPKTQ